MIKETFTETLFKNRPQKVVAVVLAFIIWALVNDSITMTRSFDKIPIKVINVPRQKTVIDLLPDGKLLQKASVTITGPKNSMLKIEPSDLEIVIDAADREEEWIAEINKRTLTCANENVNLQSDSYKILPSHLIIKLSQLIVDHLTLKINTLTGEAPPNYQFLDIWPREITYQVTGAAEKIAEYKSQELHLNCDLSLISKDELDQFKEESLDSFKDEVSFLVPKLWQKLPLQQRGLQEIKAITKANKFYINFLQRERHLLKREIPIHIFFPLGGEAKLLPENYTLAFGKGISSKNGIKVLSAPVWVNNVSQLFLSVVQDYLEVAIIIDPDNKYHSQQWSLEFVNIQELEKRYIERAMKLLDNRDLENLPPKVKHSLLKSRFQHYVQEFSLCTQNNKPLDLSIEVKKQSIHVQVN